MDNTLFKGLHNKYTVSKTLRFALKGEGDTEANFKEYILEEDKKRNEEFQEIKTYLDELHKAFIDKSLGAIEHDTFNSLLEEYLTVYKDDEAREKIEEKLREIISACFLKTNKEDYKKLFGKDIISLLIEQNKNNEKRLAVINSFGKFTTYFQGYNTARTNLYTNEAKASSISHRLINENLKTYVDNADKLRKITPILTDLQITVSRANNVNIVELLSISTYSKCLVQKDIDAYNEVIGEVNKAINLYNQSVKKGALPKLVSLKKLLLSDKTESSFAFDIIENDSQMFDKINSYSEMIGETVLCDKPYILNVFSELSSFDASEIWINSKSLTYISNKMFKNWNVLKDIIKDDYKHNNPKTERKSEAKYNEQIEIWFKRTKQFSLQELNNLIMRYQNEGIIENTASLIDFISNEVSSLINEIKVNYNNYEEGSSKEKDISLIKAYLDSIKELQTFVKCFITEEENIDKDYSFYNNIHYEELREIIPLYNMVRNYVSQKPYSTEKMPLTFNVQTFLAGWDVNKEEANLCRLYEKDGHYYLGIDNKNSKVKYDFQSTPPSTDCYKKIEYKQIAQAFRDLPHKFFAKGPKSRMSESFLKKYEEKRYKNGDTFDIEFMRELIDYFKSCIQNTRDYDVFNFHFTDTEKYENINDFYKEVQDQAYSITFKYISKEAIDSLVSSGSLFLFELVNKDFSEYSKGKPNLHTIYWKALFEEDNLKKGVYKLDGGATMYFREKSIPKEKRTIHKANEKLGNKNHDNPKKFSEFDYELIKDRRYTVDKFLFHCPIKMNFKPENRKNINEIVNTNIKNDFDNINIIGIDRGERNLLYVVVINSKGEIIEQCSLNEIKSDYMKEGKALTHTFDYNKALTTRAGDMEKARESWGTIQNIKELKSGYLSQAIHVITSLMMKYNAVIVLEDLNSGFKHSRAKIEKQIYNKFETMLESKLQYFVDKTKAKEEESGYLNAYQLVNEERKSKQNGVILYVYPQFTSAIDPVTGFVNLFNLKSTMSIPETKEFFSKFKSINYNEKENCYEFTFNYKDFTDRNYYDKNKEWTILANGERIETKKVDNQWLSSTVVLTEEFEKLFTEYNIDKADIQGSIQKQDEKKFFTTLTHLFNLMVQLRNSNAKTGEDYILSPIKDKNGVFFDSRKQDKTMPQDADANGAYNIARKGLMVLENIKSDKKNPLYVKNKDYTAFVMKPNE